MFWTGARLGQEPSLDPDEQAPTVLPDTKPKRLPTSIESALTTLSLLADRAWQLRRGPRLAGKPTGISPKPTIGASTNTA